MYMNPLHSCQHSTLAKASSLLIDWPSCNVSVETGTLLGGLNIPEGDQIFTAMLRYLVQWDQIFWLPLTYLVWGDRILWETKYNVTGLNPPSPKLCNCTQKQLGGDPLIRMYVTTP